jgi:hypothetical protein
VPEGLSAVEAEKGLSGNKSAVAIAEKRFGPNFDRAFRAWMTTDAATNPHALPGPTY